MGIHAKYESQGLVVIGQPCNQFGGQEPKEGEALIDEIRNKYNAKFMLLKKADVNGSNATPLFKYLQNHKNCPGILGFDKIKWNFTKFLVDNKGAPSKRYGPKTEPNKAIKDIENLLKN